MRRRLAMVLALALLAGPAWASGQGMSVSALTPARQGAARVSVEVRDAAVLAKLTSQGLPATAFNAVVGRGRAQVRGVTSAAAEPVYTVLAFDASGSFAAHTQEAVGLAGRYAAAVDGRQKTEVVTFGTTLNVVGSATDTAGLQQLLASVPAKTGKESVTRLKSLVEESVKRAAAGQPLASGGLRQVVVFTDAGEESSAYRIEELVASARSQGVQVHVVVFPPQKGKDLAQRLDEMRRLAEETGGRNLTGTDGDAGAALAAIAEGAKRNVWLDLAFCGVPAAGGADTLAVEVLDAGQRRAWTDQVPLDQDGLGPAAAPCPDASAAPPPVAPPADPATPSKTSWWPWVLAGLAALAAGGLAVAVIALLVRGRGENGRGENGRGDKARKGPPAAPADPTPVSPAKGPAPAPASDVVPPPLPLRNLDPFGMADLPETRLVVVQAPPGVALQKFYRMHKASLVLGARADADVDLVFDVAQVSGRHVRLELYKLGTVFVTDLESTNGTFVNGQAVGRGERVPLAAGDVLGLSRQLQLRIEQPGLVARLPGGAANGAAGAPNGATHTTAGAAPLPGGPPPGAAAAPATTASTTSTTSASPGAPAAPGDAPPDPAARKRAQTIYAPVKPPGEDR